MSAAQGIAAAIRQAAHGGDNEARRMRINELKPYVLELRKSGMGYSVIAKRVRVASTTAKRICEEHLTANEQKLARKLCFQRGRENGRAQKGSPLDGFNETARLALSLWRCPPFDYVEEE